MGDPYCSRYMFPYARLVADEITGEEGMAFNGVLLSLVTFVLYFCMKYTYAARAISYSRELTFMEVWSFSFRGHPMRRNVVPFKYIAIFFAVTGVFGWEHINREDVSGFWKVAAMLFFYLNFWARMAIYEATHWKKEIEKSIPAPVVLVILHRSIKEIGWFPRGGGWLSNLVNVANGLILLICLVRIFSI